jgi:DNA repair exonuclease SbcCD ATPase subunit
MALENSPSSDTPQTFPPAKSKKTQSIIVVALIIALLATWGYIFWNNSQNAEVLTQKDQQITTVSSQKDSLNTQLAALSSQFDALKTSDVAKDSALSEKDRDIEAKQSEIAHILHKENVTASELAKAKKLIASLNTDIDGYKTEIETLKNENTQLTTEKQQVTEERDQAKKDLDSTVTVVKAKDDVINLGSTLHISNFGIEGVEDKKSGKEKVTDDAKKIDKLHITFDVDENLIAATETKTLYVLITAPDGKLITVASLGSGEFTTRDGQTALFTQKVDIDYVQGKKLPVSTYWKQTTPFQIGDYKIDVYNNGLKVGEGLVHLKKGGLFG